MNVRTLSPRPSNEGPLKYYKLQDVTTFTGVKEWLKLNGIHKLNTNLYVDYPVQIEWFDGAKWNVDTFFWYHSRYKFVAARELMEE